MVSGLINANPIIYEKKQRRQRPASVSDFDEYSVEAIDQLEVFDHIRDIKDPEHPYSLEELNVISEDAIEVDDKRSYVRVTFTPTVQHCGMAPQIGLCLQAKLMRSLPPRYKAPFVSISVGWNLDGNGEVNSQNTLRLRVDIRVAPGSLATEAAVNKQLNDKERIAAALESPYLINMFDECLAPSYA